MNIEPTIAEQTPRDAVIPNPKARLRDQVREVMRYKHYALRTEETYWHWIRRCILFHGKRHPREMGEKRWGHIFIIDNCPCVEAYGPGGCFPEESPDEPV